jgi:hypothetical protein
VSDNHPQPILFEQIPTTSIKELIKFFDENERKSLKSPSSFDFETYLLQSHCFKPEDPVNSYRFFIVLIYYRELCKSAIECRPFAMLSSGEICEIYVGLKGIWIKPGHGDQEVLIMDRDHLNVPNRFGLPVIAFDEISWYLGTGPFDSKANPTIVEQVHATTKARLQKFPEEDFFGMATHPKVKNRKKS